MKEREKERGKEREKERETEREGTADAKAEATEGRGGAERRTVGVNRREIEVEVRHPLVKCLLTTRRQGPGRPTRKARQCVGGSR